MLICTPSIWIRWHDCLFHQLLNFVLTRNHLPQEGLEGLTKPQPDAVKTTRDTNQTVEAHTKKVVQMHYLALDLAMQLKNKVEK